MIFFKKEQQALCFCIIRREKGYRTGFRNLYNSRSYMSNRRKSKHSIHMKLPSITVNNISTSDLINAATDAVATDAHMILLWGFLFQPWYILSLNPMVMLFIRIIFQIFRWTCWSYFKNLTKLKLYILLVIAVLTIGSVRATSWIFYASKVLPMLA